MNVDVVAWASVAVGAALVVLDSWACRYFWIRSRQIESNWVLRSTLAVVVIITAACLVLTVLRAFSLLWEVNDALRLLSAIAVTSILFIPWLKYLEYKRHEGEL